MRYLKTQQNRSEMPEVNLVPMMDVIMTILTFFIIVAMTLTGIQSIDLSLPDIQDPDSKEAEKLPEPLVYELNRSQQIVLGGKPVTEQEAARGIQQYLQQNPKGAVLLKADKSLTYQKVVQVLMKMQRVGGDRVLGDRAQVRLLRLKPKSRVHPI